MVERKPLQGSEKSAYVGGHGWDHRADRARSAQSIRRVDDTEHTLLAMRGNTAIKEGRVGVVDNLLNCSNHLMSAVRTHAKCILPTYEVLGLDTGSKGCGVRGLIAWTQFRALGHSVVIGTPDELNGIPDAGINFQRNQYVNAKRKRCWNIPANGTYLGKDQ